MKHLDDNSTKSQTLANDNGPSEPWPEPKASRVTTDPTPLRQNRQKPQAKSLQPIDFGQGAKPPYNAVYGTCAPEPGALQPKAPPPETPLPLIGFDAEWVESEKVGGKPGTNRLLSHQYAGHFDGRTWAGIIYPSEDPRATDGGRGPRLKFADVLATAISRGIKLGYLKTWPKHVIAAAHWTRADLAHMADFSEIKRQFKGIKKTYVTLGKTYQASATVGKHKRKFSVTLVDTQLLVPSTVKKLESLGELYEFEKLSPGTVIDETGATVPAIGRMDLLLASNRDLFEQYAIRDAEICALHVEKMICFQRDELGLGAKTPITLGALTVDYLMKLWDQNGIDPGDVNGYRMVSETHFNKKTGKGYMTKPERREKSSYLRHEKLAALCFLGGRNECFWYGPTSDMDPALWPPVLEQYDFQTGRAVIMPAAFREYDLTAAYATALGSLGVPDYDKATVTTNAADFQVDQIGFAQIKFCFPPNTRFPCIPVKDSDDHGLIYPLSGEAYVTAPEIVLALRLGAEVEVIHGVVIPWLKNCVRPFALAIQELSRQRAQHPKGSLPNEMFKQLGNSIYGKLGQGINQKSYFNTATDDYEAGRPCPITNPYLAAHVTGLIRALVGELIAGTHKRYVVVSVTTDALITNAPLSDLDFSGPLARHMSFVRAWLIGSPTDNRIGADVLETKFHARQLMPWRNKGIATLKTALGPDGKPHKPKLAQGGMKAASGTRDNNAWFCQTMLDRDYETMWEDRGPPPFPKAHTTNSDHVFHTRLSRVNFEFDMKRRLVDPSRSYVSAPGDLDRLVQHVSCNTVPWASIDEFKRARQLSEQWHHKQRRQMRTVCDFEAWQAYLEGDAAAQQGVNRRGGIMGQVQRVFLKAYALGAWGLPGRDYARAADVLTTRGYPTTEQQLKNARRAKRQLSERTIPADAPGVREFVEAALSVWPKFEWWRMVKKIGEHSCSPRRVTAISDGCLERNLPGSRNWAYSTGTRPTTRIC